MAKDPTKRPSGPRLTNKKARFDFDILEKVEAGIALLGTEVKSLRLGNASLNEAYARVDGDQVRLINFQILPYEQAGRFNHEPKRPKQLLLHRREINKLASKVRIRGQTLIPLCVYFNSHGKAKVELALARGRTHADKRDVERKREDLREIRKAERR